MARRRGVLTALTVIALGLTFCAQMQTINNVRKVDQGMADLFDRSEVTRHEKAECIRRELKLRRRVYPRWIESGKLKRETADKEIATMEAILSDYEGPA